MTTFTYYLESHSESGEYENTWTFLTLTVTFWVYKDKLCNDLTVTNLILIRWCSQHLLCEHIMSEFVPWCFSRVNYTWWEIHWLVDTDGRHGFLAGFLTLLCYWFCNLWQLCMIKRWNLWSFCHLNVSKQSQVILKHTATCLYFRQKVWRVFQRGFRFLRSDLGFSNSWCMWQGGTWD